MPSSPLARHAGIATAVVAALLALAAWAWWSAPPRTPGGTERAAPADVRVPVVVASVRAADDTLTVEAVGTGEALRSATLRPALAGEVASVHFRAGDRVRRGQVLLRLVDRQPRLAAALAAARVDAAERLLARYAGIEGTGAVPGSVIDEARSALQLARIARDQAQETLAEHRLQAPFDGIIGLAQVEAGDRVTPDTAVAVIDDRRRLRVEFDLPEPYLAQLRPGHPVGATSVAYEGRRFEGKVVQIDSRVAADTRSLRVRAELPNDDDLLRPGQSFRVQLALPGGARLQVPDIALQWGREGSHVWVVRDGRAEQVPVRLVRRLEGTVLIDGPLRAGEPVVVEGVQRLRPGRGVRLVEAAP